MASFHHYPDTAPQMPSADQAVGIAFENGLEGIAALGDVARRFNRHHAWGKPFGLPPAFWAAFRPIATVRANPAMINEECGKPAEDLRRIGGTTFPGFPSSRRHSSHFGENRGKPKGNREENRSGKTARRLPKEPCRRGRPHLAGSHPEKAYSSSLQQPTHHCAADTPLPPRTGRRDSHAGG